LKIKQIYPNAGALDYQEGGDHYTNFKIQPAEYTILNGLGFAEGNVIKYISRHNFKGGIEDLRKARQYLEMIAEIVYEDVL
jgi:hypothetical protein